MRVLYKTDNEALNARYEKLFQELYEECVALIEDESERPAEGEIKDLNTYYLYLNKIKNSTVNYELFRLPVNIQGGENYFEINTNTRSIAVPSDLIVVQGDHAAEIVYFRMDRRFDAMDLSQFDRANPNAYGNCIIQWYHENDVDDEHYDEVYAFDYDEDYVYFGWIIGGEVTAAPGKVHFAVRLYSVNKAGSYYDYSWSTLPAMLTVKESLDFNILTFSPDQINDLSSLVQTRPLYSGIVSSSKGAKPIILKNLEEEYEITDTKAVGGNPVASITIGVEAKTNEANGTLSYQWYSYYPDSPEKAKLDGKTESTLMIDKPGQYQVVIGNTIKGGITRYVNSIVTDVPRPAEFLLTSGLPERVYIAKEGQSAQTLSVTSSQNEYNRMSYQWEVKAADATEYVAISDATGDSYSVAGDDLPEGMLRVSATAHRNNATFSRYSDQVDGHAVQLRKRPVAPEVASITLQSGTAGEADAVYVCNLANADYYSKYDPSELRYEWVTSTGGLIKDANGLELSNTNTITPFDAPALRGKTHRLGCLVYHVVWGGIQDMEDSAAQDAPTYLANVVVPSAQ